MKSPPFKSLPVLLALGIFSMAATAKAALITTTTDLPPDGVYLSADIHQTYGGAALEILLSLPEHAPIAAQAMRRNDGLGNEIENFNSVLNAMAEVRVNGLSQGILPISAFGPVETIVFGRTANPTTGSFNTEMLSMELSGVNPFDPAGPLFMVRESPTLQSLGQTDITDIGGGLFRIDSFFDVHTELSIDGGATWMPSTNGAGHVVLVPEPSSMGFLAAGLVCIVGFMRRRR